MATRVTWTTWSDPRPCFGGHAVVPGLSSPSSSATERGLHGLPVSFSKLIDIRSARHFAGGEKEHLCQRSCDERCNSSMLVGFGAAVTAIEPTTQVESIFEMSGKCIELRNSELVPEGSSSCRQVGDGINAADPWCNWESRTIRRSNRTTDGRSKGSPCFIDGGTTAVFTNRRTLPCLGRSRPRIHAGGDTVHTTELSPPLALPLNFPRATQHTITPDKKSVAMLEVILAEPETPSQERGGEPAAESAAGDTAMVSMGTP